MVVVVRVVCVCVCVCVCVVVVGGEKQHQTFASLGLAPWIQQQCKVMGMPRPTEIQSLCVPEILNGMRALWETFPCTRVRIFRMPSLLYFFSCSRLETNSSTRLLWKSRRPHGDPFCAHVHSYTHASLWLQKDGQFLFPLEILWKRTSSSR